MFKCYILYSYVIIYYDYISPVIIQLYCLIFSCIMHCWESDLGFQHGFGLLPQGRKKTIHDAGTAAAVAWYSPMDAAAAAAWPWSGGRAWGKHHKWGFSMI